LAFIVLLLFFITGAVGLAFEVLWIRMLVNIFGTTVYAVSTVISSFFAGLALGSHLFGRVAERTKNPLRLYAILEFFVGMAALMTLVVLTRMTGVWATIYSLVGTGSILYPISRFALCFVILLVPTTLMGGTLPVLSKYFVRNMKTLGWNMGLIYSINTFGALVGCFLVGFILIEAIGIRATLLAGVTCNVFVAACSLLLSLGQQQSITAIPEAADVLPIREAERESHYQLLRLVPLAFAVSGFASLSYELLWTRILVYFIGVQTHAYTIMLMTFLFGIAFGSIAFARISDRSKDNLFIFGMVEVLIGLFSIIGLFTIGRLSNISDYLTSSGFITSWWHYAGVKFIISAIFMLLPTFLIGGTFPLVSKLVVKSLNQVSTSVGKIYALNTVGGIFGSVLTGFIILPLLGVKNSVLLVVSLNVVLGFLLILGSSQRRSFPGLAANMLGMLVFVPVFFFATVDQPILSEWNRQRRGGKYDVLYSKEGIECTLSVLLNRINGARELNINGQSTAYTSYRDIQVHKMLVHVPMLLHPDPREVLVVGFGMGCTSYEATLYENSHVTCVELVKDETEAARFFEDLNKNVLENPKFTFIHDDGRNYIQLKDRTYDVISFNAIHPRLSPALYTLEFYEMCRNRMGPDSLICAWMPSNWLSVHEFQSLVKTFISVFPESTLWYCNPDHVVLVGGLNKTNIDFAEFSTKMRQPDILECLKASNLDDPFSLAGTLVLGPRGLERYSAGARVVSDNHSQVEFSRCLDYGLNEAVWVPLLDIRQQYLGELAQVISTKDSAIRATLHDNMKSLPLLVSAQILSDPKYNKHREALEDYNKALLLAPQNRNIAYWKDISQFQFVSQQGD